ncbi:MAG: class I SAM-dependent methyltransferase, partial [Planctomycetes bacterium]|nr:class I SAM-dependent methyltransferase [Planctomycetota bacterium]
MTQGDLDRWNAKYMKWKTEQGVSLQGIIPPHDEWLEICAKSMTPASALDLACGLGGNSIWLAKSGWEVTAVDISPVGLDLARQIAANQQVSNISWVAADLDEYYPEKNSFDLVIVFRYLDRTRIPSLAIESLKPGGQIV